jgi:hypothetical protein
MLGAGRWRKREFRIPDFRFKIPDSKFKESTGMILIAILCL